MSETVKFENIDFAENVIEQGGNRVKKFKESKERLSFNNNYHYRLKWRKIFRRVDSKSP